ncbi:hypothetical protein GGR50DRAFT_670724 [Xylaria sp. CBS 124048]|nr:hypothetical protein GGR50DRAFT_670724 [Xylaria sp. CBS 124048]
MTCDSMSTDNSELLVSGDTRDKDTPEQQFNEDEDEDDVSITSTNAGDNDDDKEWDVDDILAERRNPDYPDAMQYLIKWEGFELKDCTWEPLENLGDGLLAKWEENKAEIEAKTREPFDMTLFEAACAERAERHMRRNAKRQRLGMPLTLPFPPGYTGDAFGISPVNQDLSDSEGEARRKDRRDSASSSSSKSRPRSRTSTPPSATTAAATASRARKPAKQTTFKGIPAYEPPERSKTPPYAKGLPGRPSYPPSAKTSAKVSTSGARGSLPSKGGSITGYQGTAGRSSVFKPPSARISTQSASTSTTTSSAAAVAGSSTLPSAAGKNLKGKLLKATRTRQTAATLGTNVFAGGKQSKKRQTLGDVMVDPSKAPRAFSSLRIMNIAKKRGIEKGDNTAGSLNSIPSKFIIGNEDANTLSNKRSLASPASIAPIQTSHETASVSVMSPVTAQESPAVLMKSALQKGSTEATALKRKKSVRFTGEDNDEPTSANDASTNTLDTTTSPGSTDADKRAPQPSRKLSFENYQERGQAQTIEKLVKFGHAEPVMTNFTGITRHPASWLSALKAQEVLHLASTCSSFHFISQRQLLVSERLAAGAVQAALPEHTAALENVTRSLEQSSIGLQLVAPEYSILVYSARCEGWGQLNIANKINPETPLRYLIFSSPLSPQTYPSEFCRDPEAFKQLIHPNGPNNSKLIDILTGLDFKQLTPQDPNLQSKQAYMLLIPLRARQVLGTVMTWLRLHQPDRPIFTVEQSNSWFLFHEAVQTGAGGTVISHADFTLWKLEKIPGLWRMLEDQKFTFWHLDTGEHTQPQFPSDSRAESIPGTLRLTRLFPYGRAFFITPSFAISQPTKLCAFLKWFKRYAPNPGHTIVVCHGFLQFLRDITEEKRKEHNTLTSLNPNNSDVNIFFERSGRRKQDINDHFRAWELLQEMMEKFGDEETTEGIRKIHYLNEYIDPSDEQSLVNAFCWWTQLRLDRFRRFYVLGSDPETIHRAYRYIDIPRYFDTEGSDPDIAGILLQRQLFAVKLQHEADKHGTHVNIAWGTGGKVDKLSRVVGEWRKSICEAPFLFPGTIFRTGDAREIEQWLDNHRKRYDYNWAKVHLRVVSWYDRSMAAQFGDGDRKGRQFDTFSDWFMAAPPFSPRHNTWCGLFYTITDTWDEYMPQWKYDKHPWIAVLRPKNIAHFVKVGTYNSMELFIWDLAATERAKSGHALLDMQCKLIDYIHKVVPGHYDERTLSDVWYSSTTNVPFTPGDNPLDTTVRQIAEIFHHIKIELPGQPRERWTAIDSRLWTKGMSPITLMGRPVEKASSLALERIPQIAADELKPERMIWHPVHRSIGTGPTRCLNDLYEACLKARRQDPTCESIRYQYRPTSDWWADQVEEGRDYGYVHVDAASKIVDKLRNDETQSVKRQGSTDFI